MNLDLGDTRLIIRECIVQGLHRNQAAYVLATAKWETAHTMRPVRETLADSDEQAIARLDRAFKAGRLPWVSKPYWRGGFFGRGYVQLTHRFNYEKAGKKLGLNLVAVPDLALKADVACKVLVRGMIEGWFTGRRLGQYVNSDRSDYWNARRVVNGTDKAAVIAELAQEYEAALKADEYGLGNSAPLLRPRPNGQPAREAVSQTKTARGAVAQIATAATGGVASVAALDDTAQLVAIGACVALAAFGVWFFWNRLKDFRDGVR